jgi:hypothetical protein
MQAIIKTTTVDPEREIGERVPGGSADEGWNALRCLARDPLNFNPVTSRPF